MYMDLFVWYIIIIPFQKVIFCGVVANVLRCNVVVNDFDLQSQLGKVWTYPSDVS